MAKLTTALPLADLAVDGDSAAPLYRRLYENLRRAILEGRLAPGARLPSTRELAAELSVSRNTVLNAFEQLLAEGYVEGQTGSGTFVSKALPDELLNARAHVRRSTRPAAKGRTLSRRGLLLARTPVSALNPHVRGVKPFRVGVPALDAFPYETWSKILQRHWRRPRRELFATGDPAGYLPLREAIASYLGAARAVRCEPEQVIVVTGTQQAVDILARVLLDTGDAVWVEDYGYIAARSSLVAAGARLVPVTVDEEGINVREGERLYARARLAYVAPSHQYPLGVTLSLARRLELLEWASRAGAWVVEDDYDSEFRYAGRPLAAMQGLDSEGRVIYLGTFSKVLFPSLRMGYMVVPTDLADSFRNARALVGWCSPVVDQAVVADFINEGHFARHIRRMRTLYAERQAVMIEAAREHLGGLLEITPADAGLHLVGWLPEGADDRAASDAAAARGLQTQPLSAFGAREGDRRAGLVLGYAAFDEREIREGVTRLRAALEKF
ncbi:MAG TPA: PLP-dependent aminotransferase family protein [Pyrinomonadaceae bacterium]|nr:PLP-dependent aminotransferase family protein [Pyrinomonadaceae bacterium]